MAGRAGRRPLRLAYFSPLPPQRSGIADYSADLLPSLAQIADITLFNDEVRPPAGALAEPLAVLPLEAYPQARWRFDMALYHMGNSVHHADIYRMLLRFPGVVILHDIFLHHLMAHLTLERDDFAGYARELGYDLGAGGLDLAGAIRRGRQSPPLFTVALSRRLLDASLGVIVHSQYAAGIVGRQMALAGQRERPLAVVAMPVANHAGHSRRRQLGLDNGSVLFASLGQMTAAKQLAPALRACKRLLAEGVDAHYLLVGERHPEFDVAAVVDELGLEERVHVVEYAPALQDFVDWIVTADVVINLRQPTVGETSATALRALAAGRPLIVFDQGWYGELPDEVSVKVAPVDEEGLLTAMRRLANRPEERLALGRAAAAYVDAHCRPDQVSDAIIAFIHRLLDNLSWQNE